ncbi:MAG: kelch repeat-containing protein, partial [Acidobacteriota bacterium]
MRVASSISVGVTLLFAAWLPLRAADLNPIERQLRSDFPSVTIGSPATFEDAREPIGGGTVAGLRAHFKQLNSRPMPGRPEALSLPGAAAEPELRVTYPRYYGDALVAAFGKQRVVLRAVNARSAVAEASGGMLIYRQAYPSVDTVQVPGSGRSEELLLLRDRGAPLVFDFEIVEMHGVSGLAMDEGAIRFLPDGDAPSVSQIAGLHFAPIPRLLRIERPWVIDATGQRSESHAIWSLLDRGSVKILRLSVNGAGLSYPLLVDPTFSVTGSLTTARSNHTATLLQNGKVFVAGGVNSSGVLFTYEVFDPATGTVTATGNMYDVRESHTATLLRSGKVLIAGGWNGSGSTNVCEIYDPSNNTITTTGSMATARRFHTATLLSSGKVLLAGGTGNALGAASILASAELYDPAGAGTFGPTGSMATQRAALSATLLTSGKVLIAGGSNFGGFLATAELYDPASTGTFGPTGGMTDSRNEHTATVLTDGRVLITGGYANTYRTSSELYNPASGGTFGPTGSLAVGRKGHTATLLPNGKVFIAGGADTNSTFTVSAELYDPAVSGGTFSGAGTMNSARGFSAAVLLPNAQVVMVGGFNGTHLSSIELFDWANGTFASTGSLFAARQYPSSTLMTNGNVLVAGGYNGGGSGYLNSAEIYNGVSGFSSTGALNTARALHTATLLNSGQILIAGGLPSAAGSSAEVCGAVGSPFTPTTGSLNVSRNQHTATLLSSGKVLLVGGNGTGGARASAELYDPATGLFAFTGSLVGARYGHTATLLATGKVLIAGGYNGGAVTTAELYDPGSGTFSSTGGMSGARYLHSA